MSAGEGSQARSKAPDLGSGLAGVQGFESLPSHSVMDDPISVILGILGVSSLILYFIRWKFYQPDLFFRVGGEQQGNLIKVPPMGLVPFASSTTSKKKSKILELSILFDPDEVDLFKTPGVEKSLTSDRQFPVSIQFVDKIDVVRGFLQANFFNYVAKEDKFTIRFEGLSEIDSYRNTPSTRYDSPS